MKKQLLIIMLLSLGICVSAQRSNSDYDILKRKNGPIELIKQNRNIVDTIFHFEGYYYWNNTGYNDFSLEFIEQDGQTPHANNSFENSEWMFGYDVISPGDTSSYVAATSWFENPATSDDWIIFGPVPVPDDGAQLIWKRRFNEEYRNAYKVLISGTDNELSSFTDTIYEIEDAFIEGSAGMPTDPFFADPALEIDIPENYKNSDIFIAFHHQSTDMDALFIGDILYKTELLTGLSERPNQEKPYFYPNPSSGSITFESLPENESINLRIINLAGAIAYEEILQTSMGQTTHRIDLNNAHRGVYFVSIEGENQKTIEKLVISK